MSSEPTRRERPSGRPVAIIGFMGVGKSAVGRRLATELRYEFLDTDDLVERAAGKPIARVFAEDGEPEFRRLETAALRQALSFDNVVVATGGGLPCRAENRELLRACAWIVLLTADPPTILQRVQPLGRRPLLLGCDDPLKRISELLHERAESYGCHDLALDTTGSYPGATAGKIARWYRKRMREA